MTLDDKGAHEKIKPTADLMSYYRSFSDIPFADEIAEMIDAEKTAKSIFKDEFPKKDIFTLSSGR